MTSNITEEIVLRPRIIDTASYVKDRLTQISDLLEVVDNNALNPGEVTSGPRTVFQRLPRHMRRRAMSHNIKRLPRAVRHMAQNMISKTAHRKKPPSRLRRRRPTRLLKRLNRLKRQNIWLETHIWHAKRFEMGNLWGCRLPIRSYQRGYRPIYRNAINSTVVFDQSYFKLIQIESSMQIDSIDEILKLLNPFTVRGVSANFGFRPAMDGGGLEMQCLIYELQKYPYGFIGPVRFSWTTKNGDNPQKIQIWSHPSTHSKFLQLLLNSPMKKSLPTELIDENEKNSNLMLKNSHFLIRDFGSELVRIQLVGPKAMNLLNSMLNLVSDEDLAANNWQNLFGKSHEFWRENSSQLVAGNLRNGQIISLMVEDPRLTLSKMSKSSTNLNNNKNNNIGKFLLKNFEPPPPSTQLFWDIKFQRQQFSKRLSNSQLQKLQTNCLEKLKCSDYKIPILIVIRNATNSIGGGGGGGSNQVEFNRVDLLTPSGTGLDFWLAIQFANGRAAAFNDKIHLELECGNSSFPMDCADSAAGQEYAQMDTMAMKLKHTKKPSNRRINYETRLKIPKPFNFDWAQLIWDWNSTTTTTPTTTKNSFYVLRDIPALRILSEWLKKGGKNKPDKLLEQHQNALVFVRLTQIGRGKPKRMGLICLPKSEDFSIINDKTNKIPIQEPKTSINTTTINTQKKKFDDALKQQNGTEENSLKILPEISFSVASSSSSSLLKNPSSGKGEKLIRLNDLFPNLEETFLRKKRQKNVEKRKKAKENAKKRKISKIMDVLDDNPEEKEEIQEEMDVVVEEEEEIPDETTRTTTTYKEYCSRSIIGRIVRGDYCFKKAIGISYGYCALKAIENIQNTTTTTTVVLIRNTTSKFYHPARISIQIQMPDL